MRATDDVSVGKSKPLELLELSKVLLYMLSSEFQEKFQEELKKEKKEEIDKEDEEIDEVVQVDALPELMPIKSSLPSSMGSKPQVVPDVQEMEDENEFAVERFHGMGETELYFNEMYFLSRQESLVALEKGIKELIATRKTWNDEKTYDKAYKDEKFIKARDKVFGYFFENTASIRQTVVKIGDVESTVEGLPVYLKGQITLLKALDKATPSENNKNKIQQYQKLLSAVELMIKFSKTDPRDNLEKAKDFGFGFLAAAASVVEALKTAGIVVLAVVGTVIGIVVGAFSLLVAGFLDFCRFLKKGVDYGASKIATAVNNGMEDFNEARHQKGFQKPDERDRNLTKNMDERAKVQLAAKAGDLSKDDKETLLSAASATMIHDKTWSDETANIYTHLDIFKKADLDDMKVIHERYESPRLPSNEILGELTKNRTKLEEVMAKADISSVNYKRCYVVWEQLNSDIKDITKDFREEKRKASDTELTSAAGDTFKYVKKVNNAFFNGSEATAHHKSAVENLRGVTDVVRVVGREEVGLDTIESPEEKAEEGRDRPSNP